MTNHDVNHINPKHNGGRRNKSHCHRERYRTIEMLLRHDAPSEAKLIQMMQTCSRYPDSPVYKDYGQKLWKRYTEVRDAKDLSFLE